MAFPPEVAAALSGASVRQLSYCRLAKSDEPLLAPEFHEPRSRVSYSFRDVVALRAFVFLRSRRVSLQRVGQPRSHPGRPDGPHRPGAAPAACGRLVDDRRRAPRRGCGLAGLAGVAPARREQTGPHPCPGHCAGCADPRDSPGAQGRRARVPDHVPARPRRAPATPGLRRRRAGRRIGLSVRRELPAVGPLAGRPASGCPVARPAGPSPPGRRGGRVRPPPRRGAPRAQPVHRLGQGAAGQRLRVLVGDWQSAGSATGEALTGVTATGVTALAAAAAFQAPEGVWNSGADRVRLDVFALGALAYFVLAGRPPAPDRASLRERLQRDGGLDLAADLPQVSSALRNLVREATRPSVSDRLPDVAAFLDRLAQAERATGTTEDVSDPLEALAGDVVADRWQIERRLGAGSTAVGLLVSDLTVGTGPDARRVLKVAINDAASARLAAEAEVLGRITHPRVVRLVDGPVQVGNRRALVLESAGEQTLGDVLSARTRLSLDLLERWGTDLLEALVVLDRVGVDHRDIKPANLGVREGRSSRGDRSKHLVLFDFSLARAGAMALTAGTPPYLDPFLESSGRGRSR